MGVLVLRRTVNEGIWLADRDAGIEISVDVASIDGRLTTLQINAPETVSIIRKELAARENITGQHLHQNLTSKRDEDQMIGRFVRQRYIDRPSLPCACCQGYTCHCATRIDKGTRKCLRCCTCDVCALVRRWIQYQQQAALPQVMPVAVTVS